MKAVRQLLPLLAFAALMSLAGEAMAQRSSYSPARPTLSPYFGFFQVNTTPLPNYQALVRPRQDIERTFQREGVRINRLERQIQLRDTSGTRDLLRLLPQDTGAPARAATFMNVNDFYPLQRNVVPRRR